MSMDPSARNDFRQAPDTLRRTNLRRLFAPRTIAVVGASLDETKAGSQALHTLRSFPGRVVAIHPKEREIRGIACFPSFAACPDKIDLAVLAVPAIACVEVAAAASQQGVGGLFVISGGFGETGAAGIALQEQVARICATTGLRLLGPNTSGFLNPHLSCVASFVPGVEQIAAGRIAVVAQSGGVNLTIAFLLRQLGEGVSLAVGLGNAVDVGTADILRMLADDPETQAIAVHLEGVPRGRELFDVLREVTRRKPVVALVAGRSDVGDFAVSHTGNLMGSHSRTVAALSQAGAVVVERTEDLVQAAVVLADRRLPPKQRNGIGLVTGQAGPGLLIVDGLQTAGVQVPELGSETVTRLQGLLPPMTYLKNPVDTGRPGCTFPQVIEQVASDARIDALLVFGLSEPAVLDPVAALVPTHTLTSKPIVFGTLGLDEQVACVGDGLRKSRLTMVRSPERLVLAGQALDVDSRAQWRLSATGGQAKLPMTTALTRSLNEDEAKRFLSEWGIASPTRRLTRGRDEALRAFRELHKPFAVKIAADDIPHKTEAGGVFLGIGDEHSFLDALSQIERIPTSDPGRVLVEEMAPAGVDLIVGAVRDPSWGPCVVIGLGGVFTEALADYSVRLAPIGPLDVADMLGELRGNKILEGFRGMPPCDREAVALTAIALGNLLAAHPEVQEVEINPLRVTDQGAQALDALIVVG